MGWPTTSEPKTEFATLRFTVSEAADVDAAAAAAGQTRSAYLRTCVKRCQEADAKKAARKKAAQGGG